MMKLTVNSVNISERKGTIKLPVGKIVLDSHGVQGDAHSGSWHRQVSLLGTESIDKFAQEAGRAIRYGEFAENITTTGGLLYEMQPFDRLVGEQIELEVTQIGKKCHGDNCNIFKEVGNCVMPKEGIFARVVRGGELKANDQLIYHPKHYHATIITLSDRAARGEYADKSGPLLQKMLEDYYAEQNKTIICHTVILPDDANQLEDYLRKAASQNNDLIFTTGGTGIGPRDITPDVVKKLLSKEIPGIMELIRVKYGMQKLNALLSRGVAGIIDNTLIFTLPGNPKAVNEYCMEIFPILHHAMLMMAGIDGH